MSIADIFKSKKKRLITKLKSLNLVPQAMLINQFDGKNWLMNDDRVLMEIELLLLQKVSLDVAFISLTRFQLAKKQADSLGLRQESFFMNEYCQIYKLYIDLLNSK